MPTTPLRRSERIADAEWAKQQALIKEGVPEKTIKLLSGDVDRLRREVQTAVERIADMELEIENEQFDLWYAIWQTNESISIIVKESNKLLGKVQLFENAEFLGRDQGDLQMARQPTADSAISEGVFLHLRDDETVVTPELPFYLRNTYDYVHLISYHPALISNEPQPSRKRKREEFESSTEGQAPFNTICWNFVAVEESKRASKRVRRHEPPCLYEQLLAQREHVTKELQVVTERMKESRRKGNFEKAFKKLVKQQAEEKLGNVKAQVAALVQLGNALCSAKCKLKQQTFSTELDDDACSKESSDSELGTVQLSHAQNCRFDNFFDQTQVKTSELLQVLQLINPENSEENVRLVLQVLHSEHSDESVVEMEF